jgi:choline/glycine/proline betaine transport protein
MTDADGTVNIEGALFQLFQHLPGTLILTIGALVLIAIFFITSADGGNPEPTRPVRALFTFVTAILAIALQTAAIIIALPFSIVMLLICWSTVVAFRRERRAYDLARRRDFVDEIGARYGLEVEEPNERGIRLPWQRRR